MKREKVKQKATTPKRSRPARKPDEPSPDHRERFERLLDDAAPPVKKNSRNPNLVIPVAALATKVSIVCVC